MNNLFDKTDVLTVLTLDKVKAGDEGYLGDSLVELNGKIKNGYIQSVTSIDQSDYILHPFKNERTNYALFLPADKVKNKEPTYRPIATVDELFDFLLPKFELIDDEYGAQVDFDAYRKAEILLRQKITIRRIEDNFIKVMVITDIYFYGNDDNNDIYLNGDLLKYLFYKYEIQKNGEFVPFGILEEWRQ